jgi:hypothetical protein
MNHSTRNIEKALRAERPVRNAPPGFAERVIDALPSRGGKPMPALRRQSLWPRLALAAGLAFAAVIMWKGFSPEPAGTVMAGGDETPSSPLAGLKPVSLAQVQALTEKIDQPLEKELERVKADTRNAIRFVASNFMPERD